jgi:hypothetical protein
VILRGVHLHGLSRETLLGRFEKHDSRAPSTGTNC